MGSDQSGASVSAADSQTTAPADLIARLEAAAKGTPALSTGVLNACGESLGSHFLREHNVTTSLDAIVALIERRLPGWNYAVGSDRANTTRFRAAIDPVPTDPNLMGSDGATAPLALCIALLRALPTKITAVPNDH